MYHDLVLGYHFAEARTPGGTAPGMSGGALLDGLELQLGVRNVFNKRPPHDLNPVSRSYTLSYSAFGDPRLASYWLSVRKAF